MRTDWVGIGVPIDSVGRAGGTELAPAAVREEGLNPENDADGRSTQRVCHLLAGALAASLA